jgi:D-3-phosphoglycerate dehydrogenase
MKKKLLVMADMKRQYIESIAGFMEENGFEGVIGDPSEASEDELVRQANGCAAVIAGSEPWTGFVIKALGGSLEVIVRCGTGYDGIDMAAATECGVSVANIPGRNATAVAEMAVSMMLALQRRLKEYDIGMHSGRWSPLEVHELSGKIVGLLGFGVISKHVAKLLSGFGCKLLAYDIVQDNDAADKLGVEFTSFEEVISRSDIISIHLPLTAKTRSLINAAAFRAMKPGCILINTSRGGIVNTADLAAALAAGKMGGAGLDVHETEPIPDNYPLLKFENVILSPHAASSTEEAALDMIRASAEQVVLYFSGKPFNLINKQVADRKDK